MIHTLLIANRGEIARRIVRTARVMGIRTIGVYAEPDRLDPYVQEVDVAVPLGGSSPGDSYLNRRALLDAAAWQGADAIHPGYGFLATNPSFAEAVTDAGVTWVGPPSDALRTIADDDEIRDLARGLGIAVLAHARLPAVDPGSWPGVAEAVGYPLLVTGAGRHRVDGPDGLAVAVGTARGELHDPYGDASVVIEQCVVGARHIEIQILGDEHGSVVHLGERERSVSDRGRKLLDESPAPGLDPELRDRMAEAAVRLARGLRYSGPGTVEFLVSGGQFWFRRIVASLQAGHTVTEAVTGLDLVRLQLDIAGGRPLALTQYEVRGRGHALQARVYAGGTGHLHRWRLGPTLEVRCEDAVETGSTITATSEPLLAKLVAHAATRDEAAARLSRAVRELHIHGIDSNRDLLVEVLAGEEPVPEGENDPLRYEREWQRFNALIGPHLAAAALAEPSRAATDCRAWPFAPTGWRNVGEAALETWGFDRHGERWEVSYRRLARDHPLAVRRRNDEVQTPSDLFDVTIDGPSGHTSTVVELIRLDDEVTLVHFGRRGHRCTVHVVGDQLYVNSALGQSEFRLTARRERIGS